MLLLFLLGISSLLSVAESQRPPGLLIENGGSNNSMLSDTYRSTPELRRKALDEVSRGLPRFSSLLVQEVTQLNSFNYVISPLGLALTLSMVSYGARAQSLNTLRTILQLPRLKYMNNIGFQALIDDLTTYTGVELHMANGVFVSPEIHPRYKFIRAMTRTFRSPVRNIDFAESSGATDIINEWCANTTAGHIKTIVHTDDINKDTMIILINALYFKGTWLKKFDSRDTRNRTFYVDGKTETKIPTMIVEGFFQYGEYPEADAIFVQLPYLSDNNSRRMSMFIILPKTITGLDILEANFQNITVQELIRRGRKEKVYIELPKFKIENEIDLEIPLTRMDLGCLFDPKKANFRGIVSSPPLVVTKVVQKATVEINEEGSEAAAASGLVIAARFAEDGPTPFYANHPFYAIIATLGGDSEPLNVFTARFTGS